MSETKNTWGGSRPRAGRPTGSKKYKPKKIVLRVAKKKEPKTSNNGNT